MDAEMAVVPDHREHLAAQATGMLGHVDVLITSGGAWKSDRDLTVDVLKARSRLQSQADAEALIRVPEGGRAVGSRDVGARSGS
jgi:molybdopterin biosynthesis enzyme MoaB